MVKTAKKKHRVYRYHSKRIFGGADQVQKEQSNEQSEDLYLTNKKLASIAKNVASKRELHSLILMLFLYVADNYVSNVVQPDTYKFYKSELLSFMYKVARIVNEYHIFLNDVFQTTQFTTIKRRDYPLEQEMIDETAALINGINLLKTLTQAPPEAQTTNVGSKNDNTTPVIDNENLPTEPSTPSQSQQQPQPQNNEVQPPVSQWIVRQINEKIDTAKTTKGTCFSLNSTNTKISEHPYYPNPLNTDFVFCEIDELVRHAQIFTAMLQILHNIYTTSSNISDNKTIMALGKTYIGNSKFMQKYSSIMSGTKMIGNLAYSGVASSLRKASGYLTSKKNDATDTTAPTTATYGGNRKVMRTKRVIVGKRYYKGRPDPSFQIRGGGFFSSISNGASKAAMFMDQQTGVSKIGNRITSMTTSKELSPAQKTKYELMLYLDKMYDLFKVNGFDRGEEILGNELGHLSPVAREFVERKIQDDLTSVKDLKIKLDTRIAEYKNTVSASFRMKYALDETITQGNKLANFLRRVGNGQMQLKEKAKFLMGSTIKSMRSLLGFMNRNGLVGYAIGFLHIAANVLPFFTPVFPPAMALSFVASGAKYALIMLSAPVLEAPPIILKRKEDIMKAAEAMMRHDSNGKVKDADFLKKMLEYYDFLSDVKTKQAYNISFTYDASGTQQTPNISQDIIEKATEEVQGVLQTKQIKFLDKQAEEQVIKYYVSEYSAYYSISLVEALQTISIGGETSPFKRYLDKRALLNKMYIENEIAKYETLIKLYNAQTNETQNAEEIKNLKEEYEKIRIPENMQFGSLKNLEQTNLRYGFSEEFIKNIFDNAGTISVKDKTRDQLRIMAQKKNINATTTETKTGEDQAEGTHSVENTTISNVKYNDECNTITGLYVGQKQSFADKCRQQKLIEKRIKHMINAAKAWHNKYDKPQSTKNTNTPST